MVEERDAGTTPEAVEEYTPISGVGRRDADGREWFPSEGNTRYWFTQDERGRMLIRDTKGHTIRRNGADAGDPLPKYVAWDDPPAQEG